MTPNHCPSRLATSFILLAVLMLASCGGGGGRQNLEVAFEYGSLNDPVDLWLPMRWAPAIDGLEGHTPQCSLSAGSLPQGVSVNANTCEVAGTPSEGGSFSFTVQLSVSGYAGSVSSSGSFEVIPPRFSYMGQPLESLDWKAYSSSKPHWIGYQPVAGDTLSDFTTEQSNLPLGLSMAPDTGVISGTFIGFSASSVLLKGKLTHAGKTVDVQSIPIEPIVANPAVGYPPGTPSGSVGHPVTSTRPIFSDGTPIRTPYVAAFRIDTSGRCPTPLPAGLQLDPVTGVVSGTPTEPSTGCVEIAYEVAIANGGSLMGSLDSPVWVYP